MSDPIPCVGCEHPLSRHYYAIDGTVRCLVVESGTSSSGVIGIGWSHDCDCVNHESERAAARRAVEEKARRKEDEWVEDLRRSIRASLDTAPAVVSPTPEDTGDTKNG